MKIAVSGASGFVGGQIRRTFEARGCEVIALTREDFQGAEAPLAKKIQGCDAIFNLAGEPVNKRWTGQYQQAIYDSRILTTRFLVKVMGQLDERPKCFISTSGIGIFEQHGSFTEDDIPGATDFLGQLARDWETEAQTAQLLGIRTLIFRSPLVLGKDGGLIKQILPIFRLGMGGTIGDGSQNFSWVHIHDLIRIYEFALAHQDMRGVYHPCAPHPVTNRIFTKKLGKLLKRPTLLPIPYFILKLALGQGAQVVVSGQHVTSKRLPQAGFKFEYETIDQALTALVC